MDPVGGSRIVGRSEQTGTLRFTISVVARYPEEETAVSKCSSSGQLEARRAPVGEGRGEAARDVNALVGQVGGRPSTADLVRVVGRRYGHVVKDKRI